MIKLTFRVQREVFNIFIDKEEIWYSDRRWHKGIRCIPKDEDFIHRIKMSRNQIPTFLINLFDLTKEEEVEYNSAKNDEEKLADFVIKDCKKLGGKLEYKEKA
jgi:hypothetical protein